MPKIHVSSLISAPVERVWQYIRDFNSLPEWFPGVVDSHIEAGKTAGQEGCVRNFGLEGGPRIREQMLELSDRDHRCRYKMIESPLPISNYVATVRLSAGDGAVTQMEIVSQFDCGEAHEKEMVGMLTSTYQGAFELVKKHFGKT